MMMLRVMVGIDGRGRVSPNLSAVDSSVIGMMNVYCTAPNVSDISLSTDRVCV